MSHVSHDSNSNSLSHTYVVLRGAGALDVRFLKVAEEVEEGNFQPTHAEVLDNHFTDPMLHIVWWSWKIWAEGIMPRKVAKIRQ